MSSLVAVSGGGLKENFPAAMLLTAIVVGALVGAVLKFGHAVERLVRWLGDG